jgi:formate--tetrahydrofolate ligase
LAPDTVVLVATVRALKMHGGGPPVTAGKPLDHAYKNENLDLVKAGCANMIRHIQNITSFGVPVVVALNKFATDTEAELDIVRQEALEHGADDAVVCRHHALGGKGAVDLANAIIKSSSTKSSSSSFNYLYPSTGISIKDKVSTIATKIYGAAGVEYSPEADASIERYENMGLSDLPICMAKTQYSFSDDAALKGAPTGHTLHVREVRASVGAGFLVMITGKMMMMPGLPTRPAFFNIDIETETGKILGLS